jgi:hypothetical protein
VVPILALLTALVHPAGWLILSLWPLQVARLTPQLGLETAFFLVLGKVPESHGVLTYWFNRLRHRKAGLIEYK